MITLTYNISSQTISLSWEVEDQEKLTADGLSELKDQCNGIIEWIKEQVKK